MSSDDETLEHDRAEVDPRIEVMRRWGISSPPKGGHSPWPSGLAPWNNFCSGGHFDEDDSPPDPAYVALLQAAAAYEERLLEKARREREGARLAVDAELAIEAALARSNYFDFADITKHLRNVSKEAMVRIVTRENCMRFFTASHSALQFISVFPDDAIKFHLKTILEMVDEIMDEGTKYFDAHEKCNLLWDHYISPLSKRFPAEITTFVATTIVPRLLLLPLSQNQKLLGNMAMLAKIAHANPDCAEPFAVRALCKKFDEVVSVSGALSSLPSSAGGGGGLLLARFRDFLKRVERERAERRFAVLKCLHRLCAIANAEEGGGASRAQTNRVLEDLKAHAEKSETPKKKINRKHRKREKEKEGKLQEDKLKWVTKPALLGILAFEIIESADLWRHLLEFL